MAKFCDWFEGRVADILKEVSLTKKAKLYRYPDKKAAGRGYSNKQPADFFLLLAGAHFDLEVKSSENKDDFNKCYKALVKDHQMTSARKTVRAGGKYYFLFASKLFKHFEIWDSEDLIDCYYISRKTPQAKPIAKLSINCSSEEFCSALK